MAGSAMSPPLIHGKARLYLNNGQTNPAKPSPGLGGDTGALLKSRRE